MATKGILNQAQQAQFVKASVNNILFDQNLLAKFRQSPDRVLTDKVRNIPKPQKEVIKAEIQQKVIDADQVLPGLNIDEAKEMLYSSLRAPRATFLIFTWLNVTLFAVGITLFVLAAVAGLAREQEQFSIIFGVGGFASLLPLFITNPLKRISNSASDQSQLRTVIFGYWSQLANLRTQIQSSESPPDLKTVKELNAELQLAMQHATELLQKNVEAKIQEINPAYEEDMKALKERVETLEKKLGEQSA